MRITEKELLRQMIRETVYALNEKNLDESIKSHIAAAGLGALATYGGMTGKTANDTQKNVQIPHEVIYQQPSRQTRQQIPDYKLHSSLSHLQNFIKPYYNYMWDLKRDPDSKIDANIMLEQWENMVFDMLKQIGANPDDIYLDRDNEPRIRLGRQSADISPNTREDETPPYRRYLKPIRQSTINYFKKLYNK